ncbi:MAG: hypothetical protein WCT46_05400 [Candidatus Gracilibacteria bacterium]|jgi:hypothetical protein
MTEADSLGGSSAVDHSVLSSRSVLKTQLDPCFGALSLVDVKGQPSSSEDSFHLFATRMAYRLVCATPFDIHNPSFDFPTLLRQFTASVLLICPNSQLHEINQAFYVACTLFMGELRDALVRAMRMDFELTVLQHLSSVRTRDVR